jgi:hypothetical protein
VKYGVKKYLAFILVFLFFFLPASGVTAAESSYTKAVKYYLDKDSLENADEVIAAGSLGIDISGQEMKVFDIRNQDFDSMYASTLAKNMIALVLLGYDPRNVNGKDLVAMLEGYIGSDGSIDKSGLKADANNQVYCLLALEITRGKKDLSTCYDRLIAVQMKDGAFGYGSWESLDVTGWVLDLYGLSDQTAAIRASATAAMNYVKSLYQTSSGTWDEGFGANSNTQACALIGLLGYDQSYTKGSYPEAYAALEAYQNKDGWFGWTDSTNFNELSTVQAVQAVGYWKYGSVMARAKALYDSKYPAAEEKATESDATASNADTIVNNITVTNPDPKVTVNTTVPDSTVEVNPDITLEPDITLNPEITVKPDISVTPNITVTPNILFTPEIKVSPVINTPEIHIPPSPSAPVYEIRDQGAVPQGSTGVKGITVTPVITVQNTARDYSAYIKIALVLLTILTGLEAVKVVAALGDRK